MKVSKFGYLVFMVPALLGPLGFLLGRRTGHETLFSFLVPLFVFAFIPVIDAAFGRDASNPSPEEERAQLGDRFYTALLIACVPAQFAQLGFGYWVTTHGDLSVAGRLGWVLSVGLASGVLAINTGHELIHRKNPTLGRLGGLLLASVWYASFKVEHVQGHHVHVATKHDGSTARRGEGVYGFVWRALKGNIGRAFELERAQRTRRGQTFRWYQGELWAWYSLSAVLLAGATLVGGLWGFLFFAGQSLVAIVLLEVVNYVEHYGLERRVTAVRKRDGATLEVYETTTPAHSWNSSYIVTNLLLFQLQRHADHHANAARPYQVLRVIAGSPELPAGYATMVLLALVPPLFRAVMDPRIPAAPLAPSPA